MQPERGSPAYEALDSHAAPRKKLRIAFSDDAHIPSLVKSRKGITPSCR